MSNQVDLIRGAHYPAVSQARVERDRRCQMLSRWGITDFEERLKDNPNAVEEEIAERELQQLLQRRDLEKQAQARKEALKQWNIQQHARKGK